MISDTHCSRQKSRLGRGSRSIDLEPRFVLRTTPWQARLRPPGTSAWQAANPVDSPDRVRIICVRTARWSESGRLFHALAPKAGTRLPLGMWAARSFAETRYGSGAFLAAATRAGRAKGRDIAVNHWRAKPCEFFARSTVGRRFTHGAAVGGPLAVRSTRDLFSNTQSPTGQGPHLQIL